MSIRTRVLSRSFTAGANGNKMDDNELKTKWANIESNAKQLEVDNESITQLEKWVKHIIPLAKSGESKFKNIEATLKDECLFSESKAGLMAQWFVDTFTEAPKGIYIHFYILFCLIFGLNCFIFCFAVEFYGNLRGAKKEKVRNF